MNFIFGAYVPTNDMCPPRAVKMDLPIPSGKLCAKSDTKSNMAILQALLCSLDAKSCPDAQDPKDKLLTERPGSDLRLRRFPLRESSNSESVGEAFRFLTLVSFSEASNGSSLSAARGWPSSPTSFLSSN